MLKKVISIFIAAMLVMTAFASMAFAQEDQAAAEAAQTEEGDSSSLTDLVSGLLSDLGEKADISSEDLADLFSSLLSSGDGSLFATSWAPSYEWTIDTEDYGYQLPEDAQAAFEAATQTLLGKTYSPIVLLETQVVSGINYRILCVGTVVAPDAKPELDVLTIYQDLQGNASVTDITALDLNVVYSLNGTDAFEEEDNSSPLAGGWSIPVEETTVSLPEKVVNDIKEYEEDLEDGHTYLPLAVLGTTINDDNLFTTAVLVKMTAKDDESDVRYEMIFTAKDDDDWTGGVYRAPLNWDKLLAHDEDAQEGAQEIVQEDSAE